MNLLYGEIVEVSPGAETRVGKVRVRGVLKNISLDLLTDPAPGDTVLVCEGVALGKVERAAGRETDHVPGRTR